MSDQQAVAARVEEVAAILANLEPHQQRVVAEFHELQGRLEKLESFIGSAAFQAVHRSERIVLLRQASAMEDYADCLYARIELWTPIDEEGRA
jgi:hypothetical protein